jgi:hypothetical protein
MQIIFQGPWIFGQVFLVIELDWVDKDAATSNLILPDRSFHEIDVALVQCAHGRNKADAPAGIAERFKPFPRFDYIVNKFQIPNLKFQTKFKYPIPDLGLIFTEKH